MFGKKKTEREIAEAQLERVQNYQRVFHNPEGHKVLHHLMDKFGMMKTTATDDPYNTYYREGQRAVVLEILKNLKVNLREFQQLIDKGEYNDE